MTWPAYPDYKESGVRWLDRVPESWLTSRMGYETWVRARLGWKGLKAEEYVDDGVAFLSTPNIRGKDIDFANVDRITGERYAESPEIKLCVGDVLLAKDGSTLGSVNLVRHLPEPATVNGSIAVITPCDRLDSRYLCYLIGSSFISNGIQMLKGGMGVPHLFQDDIRRFKIPVPPASEQAAIVRFLDCETGKIDELIDKQEQLIATLHEHRTATITHAVTKGLNPDTEMKDCAVGALRAIPLGWEAISLKRTCSVLDCKHVTAEFVDDGFPLASIREVQSRYVDLSAAKMTTDFFIDQLSEGGRRPRPGDLIFSRNATVGEVAQVPANGPDFALGQDVCLLRPAPAKLDPSYLWYALRSSFVQNQIALAMIGSTFKRINVEQIRTLDVTVPPLGEQREIVAHLDAETARIDALIGKATEVIGTLREYRSALITAAVTGKIDVREVV